MKKQKIEINGGMTIAQILELKKQAPEIFMGFGMFCFGCPHSQGETLAEAAIGHGVDLDLMIKKLNEAK